MTMPDLSSSVIIRNAQPSDEAAILDICLRTSDGGQDGSHLYTDPRLPGLLWALPYVRFCAVHAFVLTKDAAVMGYCVAAPNTIAYEEWLKVEWWPYLKSELRDFCAETAEDEDILSYIEGAPRTPPQVTDLFPAHLHINLLPEIQNGGHGSVLLRHQLDALERAGVTGIHLGVNQKNEEVAAFYAKFGFVELDRRPSILMAKRIA
ncbi:MULTISPECIES: GNAT family N-acetyltransferase [Rhizobium/Agrobacterium group]|uniref:GNAT family N-acetyltransferase n=1 Tax=Rhizobium rhizogenes TaxID=359 RepID=A0A546XM32_RHIRH|nr:MULTISPECIES: GNAT family N-acetyltransferase [Rhizobium/Agrobacterium group]TRB01779.1 GNAT family N-acetyltransferase [Rhizobium rhizogenes]